MQVVYFLCHGLELVIAINLPNNIVNYMFEIHCCYNKFGWSLMLFQFVMDFNLWTI